jgi:hypothetical protein
MTAPIATANATISPLPLVRCTNSMVATIAPGSARKNEFIAR